MNYSRRDILKASVAATLSLSVNRYMHAKSEIVQHNNYEISYNTGHNDVFQLARDETFWTQVSSQFEIDENFINLENGYYGIMPKCVYDVYLENTSRLNRFNSYLLRTTWKQELQVAREYLAQVLGVSDQEIVFTRNGTDAMQKLIAGYNKLQPGDQVLYADLDFHSCQDACDWLKYRRNVSIVKINIPEPATKENVLEAYTDAFERYPRLKMILLTHMNNKTGLVLPIDEIVTLARANGIDAIVDAAHSWGQMDFVLPDLKADFVGLTMHKWIHAPLGLGCIYIKKNRLQDIDTCFGSKQFPSSDIRSRVLNGTDNMAVGLTLPTALDFHLKLGASLKQERLKYLRDSWVQHVRNTDLIEVLTPDEPSMYNAITSFRFKNITSTAENDEIVKTFFERYKIFLTRRTDIYFGDCIRVTPAIYTKLSDIQLFTKALLEVSSDYR